MVLIFYSFTKIGSKFSSPKSHLRPLGLLVPGQMAYATVFGLNRAQRRSYVISCFLRSGPRRSVVEVSDETVKKENSIELM